VIVLCVGARESMRAVWRRGVVIYTDKRTFACVASNPDLRYR